MFRVALVSIGWFPSVATRNLATYVLNRHPDWTDHLTFLIRDISLVDFENDARQIARTWAFNSSHDRLLRELLAFSPDLVGFSCYVWNIESILKLSDSLKRLLPHCKVLLGGPNAGYLAKPILTQHPAVDWVVTGDGEVPFEHLIEGLMASNLRCGDIGGLIYRTSAGVRCNSPDPSALDLKLTAGAFERFPPHPGPNDYVLYETQRGCPYSCTYCTYGRRPVVRKELSLVVSEVVALLHRHPVYLVDPSFCSDKARARTLLAALAAQQCENRLYFETHPDSLDRELVELFGPANVKPVGLGLQTLSPKGNAKIGRRLRLDRFERAVRMLREFGISYYIDIIYGLPDTTVEDFIETVHYLYNLGVTNLYIYRLLGLPGSQMAADAEKDGLVFSSSPPYELMRSLTYSLDDLVFCGELTYALGTILSQPERFRSVCDPVRFPASFLEALYQQFKQTGRFEIEPDDG